MSKIKQLIAFLKGWIITVFNNNLKPRLIPIRTWIIANKIKSGITTFVTLSVIMNIAFVSSWLSQSNLTSGTQFVPDSIYIVMDGNLRASALLQGERNVKKGDIIIIKDVGSLVNKQIWRDPLPIQKILLSEILCFTIPGKKGNYWMGKDYPTVIEVKEDGVIKFSLNYPSALTNFATTTATSSEKNKLPYAEVKFNKVTNFPEQYSKPRQLVRLNGLAGTILPDFKLEKKNPDFKLR